MKERHMYTHTWLFQIMEISPPNVTKIWLEEGMEKMGRKVAVVMGRTQSNSLVLRHFTMQGKKEGKHAFQALKLKQENVCACAEMLQQ